MIKTLVYLRDICIFKKYLLLAGLTTAKLPTNTNENFVVSIASYPKRDPLLPAVFQALSKQKKLPKKWILVLSEEDYKHGLPNHLRKLKKRGLEIIWVKDNPYSVKKLIPVIETYPDSSVITLDDDIIYHPDLIKGLIAQSKINSKAIIGYVGKTMVKKENQISMFYRERTPTDINTPSKQVYLIGWGGIFYPPYSLDEKVLDMEAVHKIVPGRGSDFWFWAAAHANNTKQVCLGMPQKYNLGIPIPQNKNTKPKDVPDDDILMERFQKTIDYFEIREELTQKLPELN